MSESQTKECPFCGETIKAVAVKCKHCGEFLAADTPGVSTATGVLPLERCAEEDVVGFEEWEVVNLLNALAERSLVHRDPESGRYRLLETVRQYARDRLAESGEAIRARSAHRGYYLALAEEASPRLRGPEQAEWLSRLEEEHENLRGALTHCLEMEVSGEAGLRLAGALWGFWNVRGHLTEGREWLAAVLERGEECRRERMVALTGAGALARSQGDYDQARSYHEACLAVARDMGDQEGVAACLGHLAAVDLHQGEYERARAYLEQSLAVGRDTGDQRRNAGSLHNLGNIYSRLGEYEQARHVYEQALTINRSAGNRQWEAFNLDSLGDVAFRMGDNRRASALHEEALAIKREIGDRPGIANCLGYLGNLASAQGDHERARSYHEESLRMRQELGDRPGIAFSLEGLALGEARQEQPRRAACLAGAATGLRERIGAPQPPDEQPEWDECLASLRTALGQEAFSSAWAKGQAMSLAQVISYALRERE